MDLKRVNILTTVPTTDGNFTSALRSATLLELRTAIKLMENKSGNKSRTAACERAIRQIKKNEPVPAATDTSS